MAGAVYAPLLERLWFGGSESRVNNDRARHRVWTELRSARRIAVREPPRKGWSG